MTKNSDMFCDYRHLLDDLQVGNKIEIEGGLMTVIVEETHSDYLLVRSEDACAIGSRRHMNFPGIKLKLPGLTTKDKADLLFGIENGINYVAASFIRHKKNVEEIRKFLEQHNGKTIQIISKIENQEGITNIEEIVQVSDGIMIARGDLGIETPIHELPYFQRYILDACFKYGRTCIMATELLKSMTTSPFPTRAEVSDVYNSVIARVDAVMLSDETAIGKFPLETLTLMRKTVEEAEKHTLNKHKEFEIVGHNHISEEKKLISKHALFLADEIGAKCIIVFSHSAKFPKIIAGLKTNQPVYAFTPEGEVINKMRILFGIQGIKLEKRAEHTTENQDIAVKLLLQKKYVQK
jgi:pyruvate kinase